MLTAKPGDLVYYETMLHGLIPAKLQSFNGDEVVLVLTADRPTNGSGYRKGDTIHTNLLHCIPRSAVIKRGYSSHILPYALLDPQGREISTFPSPFK